MRDRNTTIIMHDNIFGEDDFANRPLKGHSKKWLQQSGFTGF